MNMGSKYSDTVTPVRFVPHTPGAVSLALSLLEDDGIPMVSVDNYGNVMSVLFLSAEGMLWYRSSIEGSDFGIPKEAFK
jgi:hypothetical protein